MSEFERNGERLVTAMKLVGIIAALVLVLVYSDNPIRSAIGVALGFFLTLGFYIGRFLFRFWRWHRAFKAWAKRDRELMDEFFMALATANHERMRQISYQVEKNYEGYAEQWHQ